MSGAIRKAKADFLREHPHATLSKFEFDPIMEGWGETKVKRVDIFFKVNDELSYDITSSTFKNDKSMTKWLSNNTPFPKIWQSGGRAPDLLKTDSSMERDSGKVVHFPPYVVNYQVNDFPIYVDDHNSFKSNLPKIVIDTKRFYDDPELGRASAVWTLSKSYYQAIAAILHSDL